MTQKKLETIGWAGFTDDKIDFGMLRDEGFRDGLFGIFKTRKEAKIYYEDVRKIKITQL